MQGADSQPLLVWAGAMVLAALVFTLWPGIDLWVSGLFYRPETGFAVAGWGVVERLRQMLWRASEAVIWAALVGLGVSLITDRPALWLPGRLWGFVVALYVLGPGVIVNLVLKAHWGRARPDTVEAFGGPLHFTPALHPAQECLRNCSFVSGEVASAVALAITIYVVLRHLRPRLSMRMWRVGLYAAIASVAFGILARLAVGRHFLSDVTFAALIVVGIALLLDRPFRVGLLGARFPDGRVLTTPATPPIRPKT